MQHTHSRRVDPYDFSITAELQDADIQKVFGAGGDPDDAFFKLFGPQLHPGQELEAKDVPKFLRLVADVWERALDPVVNTTIGGEVPKP